MEADAEMVELDVYRWRQREQQREQLGRAKEQQDQQEAAVAQSLHQGLRGEHASWKQIVVKNPIIAEGKKRMPSEHLDTRGEPKNTLLEPKYKEGAQKRKPSLSLQRDELKKHCTSGQIQDEFHSDSSISSLESFEDVSTFKGKKSIQPTVMDYVMPGSTSSEDESGEDRYTVGKKNKDGRGVAKNKTKVGPGGPVKKILDLRNSEVAEGGVISLSQIIAETLQIARSSDAVVCKVDGGPIPVQDVRANGAASLI